MNSLTQLSLLGQSPWLDYIKRSLIKSGQLEKMIAEDGLGGITSNPAIFEKAIAGSDEYADLLAELRTDHSLTPMAIYERIAIRDIQDAADTLRPVYEREAGCDGFVSLEVSPFLAHDTAATISEARRLWKAVDRPNLMIKIPGTLEGVPAVEEVIADGINVNVTLLFSVAAYEAVAWAFVSGLARRVNAGLPVARVASVASFFVSRIDAAVDPLLKDESLRGRVAIANAKIAYAKYKEIFSSSQWESLKEFTPQPQRVLWASTGVKDPKYSDVRYIESLIGPNTVNTIPPATLDAFRDHGVAKSTLEDGLEEAVAIMKAVAAEGIDFSRVTSDLVTQGVKLFADAFDKLLNAVNQRCRTTSGIVLNKQSYKVDNIYAPQIDGLLESWRVRGNVHRLWDKDASLWTGQGENEWLAWLKITEQQLHDLQVLTDFQAEVKARGFSHILLLGMGGSSLCPEVLQLTFGRQEGFPELHVLDSTDPAQVAAFAAKIDVANTLFIVSTKSGSTLEPNIFKQYFFDLAHNNGNQFVTVTDPGKQMEKIATTDQFWKIFPGLHEIGGRYSALSNFGMIPAAAMGLDVKRFLENADAMAAACSPCLPLGGNPGVLLGLVLGTLANRGRDKLTVVASPGISDLGAWLEQLVAESTGKLGKGIIPVDREPLASADHYGKDRVFVYLRLATAPDNTQDSYIELFEAAGHPVVRIDVADVYTIGQEFFRWEIATAVAGAVMGINPFDQPDVEASKIATRVLTDEFEKNGSLPAETPIYAADGISLYTDAANAAAVGVHNSLTSYLKAHFDRIKAGDYVALLGYIHMNQANEDSLQNMRRAIRDSRKVATCLGFGPRFLHSTGQGYKGGPNTGVFLQVTCDDAADLKVPGQTYTFGTVKAAQARGDFKVLADRERRALRVHLGTDVAAGLATLSEAVHKALNG